METGFTDMQLGRTTFLITLHFTEKGTEYLDGKGKTHDSEGCSGRELLSKPFFKGKDRIVADRA